MPMTLSAAGLPFRHRPAGRPGRIHAHVLVQLVVFHLCGAAPVIIDDFSPRIVYNTPVLPESTCRFQPGVAACDRHWWYEHGDSRGADLNDTVHTTWGPGTVATLEFRGPSISLYGIQLVQFGAQALVTLDREPPVRIDSNVTELPDGASLRTQQLLYSKTGLDPSSSHKISVAYDDSAFDPSSRAWFSIDYFVVDESPQSSGSVTTSSAPPNPPPSRTTPTTLPQELPGAPSLTTAPSSVTPTGSPPSFQGRPIASPEPSSVQSPATATKSQKVNVGLIVGGVLGGVAGGLLIALLAVSTWRRRRDRALRRGSSRQMLSPLLDMAATTPTLETSSAMFFPQATSYAPSSVSDSAAEHQARQLALASMPPPYSPSSSLVIAPAERRKG